MVDDADRSSIVALDPGADGSASPQAAHLPALSSALVSSVWQFGQLDMCFDIGFGLQTSKRSFVTSARPAHLSLRPLGRVRPTHVSVGLSRRECD